MDRDYSPLEYEALTHSIRIPGSPFAEVFTRFGRDEVVGLILGAAGTACMDLVLNSISQGKTSKGLAEALVLGAGIVGEKVGIYLPYVVEACVNYRQISSEQRPSFPGYLKNFMARGNQTLVENLVLGDLIYLGIMHFGLQQLPETPAALIAIPCLFGEVLAVATIEIGLKELLYKRYQRKLQRAGFQKESYFQAQFLIESKHDPDELLDEMLMRYGLESVREETFHDSYFTDPSIRHYNGRTPHVRLRRVTSTLEIGEESTSALQILFTKPTKMPSHDPKEIQYYLTAKDRFSLTLPSEETTSLLDTVDDCVQRILRKAIRSDSYTDVHVERLSAYNPDNLFVAADRVVEENPFYELTMKVKRDVSLLRDAMGYIMARCPVLPTTRPLEEQVARYRHRRRERILLPFGLPRAVRRRERQNGPAGI